MSESESDEDYVPDAPEKLSEEDTDDEETEQQSDSETTTNKGKRKTKHTVTKRKKRKFTESPIKEVMSQNGSETTAVNNEEDLWSKFLNDGGETKSKRTEACKSGAGKEETESKVYEFAGEKVIVQGTKVVTEKAHCKPDTSSSMPEKTKPKSRVAGAGLSSLLGQLGKKNKLSTLEKTKLDWNTFKDQEGIGEELESFNKGKDGYLERQDFLERSDLRRFEVEKSLRANKRGNI